MYKLLICFLTLALISCGNNSSSKRSEKMDLLDSLEMEVMRVHDESMLGMSDLKSIKKALTTLDDSEFSAETKSAVTKARQELTLADSLMWKWMHEYKMPSATDRKDRPATEAFFRDEFEKISRVDALMNSSIENGNQLYDRLKSQVDEK